MELSLVMSHCGRTTYPSSASRMAGTKISATVTLPLPKVSTASSQAAAAPVQLWLDLNLTQNMVDLV